MNEENHRSIEQYQQILTKVQGLEDQLKQARLEIETKDRQIKEYDITLARIKDDSKNSKDTFEIYNQYLGNQNVGNKDKLQSHFISSDVPSQVSNRTNQNLNIQDNYVAIRNRSRSGDKGSQQYLRNLDQDVEDDYRNAQDEKEAQFLNRRTDSGYF